VRSPKLIKPGKPPDNGSRFSLWHLSYATFKRFKKQKNINRYQAADIDVVVDKDQDLDIVFEFNLEPVDVGEGLKEVSGWIKAVEPVESDTSNKYIWDGEEVESLSVVIDWLNS
jgi:hypothetical protein